VTHIEIFSGDDLKAFADKAKEEYAKKDSKERPNPTKIEVPEAKILYKKVEKCKLSQDANIRKGFSNISERYKNTTTLKDTSLEIDTSQSQRVGNYTRVLVTKIDDEDVIGKGLTVIDSVESVQNFVSASDS
jgi:hypothetical protein